MKKLFLLLSLICISAFSQTLPVTQANNLKITNPVIGQKSDSVLVWRASDKFVRFVPASYYIPTVVTNLSYTPSPSQGTVNSDTGTGAVIPLANSTQAGLVSYERYTYNNQQTSGNPIAESMYSALSSEGWILNNTAVEQEKLLQSININTATSGTINFAIGIIDQRGIFLARLEFEKTVVNGNNNIVFNELMKKFEVLAVKLPIAANLIGSTYNIDGKLMYTPDGYSGELSGQPYDLNIQLNTQDAIRNPLVFESQLQQLDDRVVILENEGLTTTSPDGTVYEITANNAGEIEVGGLSYSSVVHLGNSLALHPWSLDPGSYWWGNWGMAASEKEKDYVHQFKSLLEASGSTVANDVYTIVEWEWNYATWDKSQLIPMIDGKELVVIRLGENVSYAPDFKSEFKELLQYILDYNPDVKLLVGGLFWYNELKETAMREATMELGLPFVQLYQLNTTENQSFIGAMVYGEDGELHEITVSGVAEHPGDLGMQRIAETLFSGLGANMKKPLAYKNDVLLKENATEEPQPYTENIIPLRTEDGSLKMTRAILTEPDVFTENMTAAVGMFNGTNLAVKFSALALKKFLNTETTQGLISRNNQQTNTLTMLNASFLAFGFDMGIAFGQGGAVLGYLPFSQSIDANSNPVDRIINPSNNTGFGKIPTEKVDVNGNVKANNFITNNATASNQALAYGQLGTGWASYSDTAYTVSSPFSIATGITSTLPNNAGTIINDQLPIGVTSFYNSSTSKITPENNGDYYVVTVRFKAQTDAPTAGYFDFGIDIGGALGVQFKETKIFAKGANKEHDFTIISPLYTKETFLANGGTVKITSVNGNMIVYNISYQIDRTHKSK